METRKKNTVAARKAFNTHSARRHERFDSYDPQKDGSAYDWAEKTLDYFLYEHDQPLNMADRIALAGLRNHVHQIQMAKAQDLDRQTSAGREGHLSFERSDAYRLPLTR